LSAAFQLAWETFRAGQSRCIFISYKFDDALEVKHRLREALDELDVETVEWQPTLPAFFFGASVTWATDAFIATSLFSQLPELLRSCQARLTDILRLTLRSALREVERLVHLLLSLAKSKDHPKTDLLIERRWFLFHGVHPPRLRLAAARAFWPGRVCLSGVI
jgi:hypothetical protein